MKLTFELYVVLRLFLEIGSRVSTVEASTFP